MEDIGAPVAFELLKIHRVFVHFEQLDNKRNLNMVATGPAHRGKLDMPTLTVHCLSKRRDDLLYVGIV